MIASLRGQLTELILAGDSTADVVVEVAGVGYRVGVGARLAGRLGPPGGEVTLAVHTHVREGAIALYGFADAAERRTFELLINTHGVGPALALAMLNVLGPAALAAAIGAGDVDALVAIPGIGRKTAQRLIVELGPSFAGADARALDLTPSAVHDELREALVSLGYGSDEVRDVLKTLSGEGDLEDLLREALVGLAPRP